MLGDALLVAPVFSPDGAVDYYLPPGRWTHFLDGRVAEGGRWYRETYDYLSLPLLARPNSMIAVGADEQRPDYEYADGITFHVFEPQDGATLTADVPTPAGEMAMTLQVRREGSDLHIQAGGATSSWRVLLRGVEQVGAFEGGSSEADTLGTLIVPSKGTASLTVRLELFDE
jgi:alpha-D-xyloside xylohydrolase